MNFFTTAVAAAAADPWGPWPLGTAHVIAVAVTVLAYLIAGAYSEALTYAPGVDSDEAAARIRRPFAIVAAAVAGTFLLIALPVYLLTV